MVHRSAWCAFWRWCWTNWRSVALSLTFVIIDHLESHYPVIVRNLQGLGAKFAIIGGVAISIRTVERFTKDLDIAIAVQSDKEAEEIVLSLSRMGYFVETVIEQDEANRLATVRFSCLGPPKILVDLLFSSSGIEPEIVETAEESEMFPGITGMVATIPSLIALKILSADSIRRMQDIIDIQYLLKDATPQDITEARQLLDLITTRGYNRYKDLQAELDKYIEQFSG